MSCIENSYRRWEGASTGVWQRRSVIVRTGLRLCLKSKLLRFVIALSWTLALGMTGIYFLFGQLMADDSALLSRIAELGGKQLAAAISGVTAWFLLYPEVCVDGLYRVTFFMATNAYISICFFAVILFIPKLIAQDLSSNAIVIYNSKALTRFDYMIGKFGIVFGILGMIWIGPITFAWTLGNLMSPSWSFFVHSLTAFLYAIGIATIGCALVSALALAVSAMAKRSSAAVALWVLGWIALGIVSSIIGLLHPWAKMLSPSAAIKELSRGLFELQSVLARAQEMLPFFNLKLDLAEAPQPLRNTLLATSPELLPVIIITGYCLLAFLFISKRVTSE